MTNDPERASTEEPLFKANEGKKDQSPQEKSIVSEIVGDSAPMEFKDKEFSDEQREAGITVDSDENGTLVFDTKATEDRIKILVEDLKRRAEDGTIGESYDFGYGLELEDDNFIQLLIEYLSASQDDPDVLASKGITDSELIQKLKGAAQLMKDAAQKSLIETMIGTQVPQLPIKIVTLADPNATPAPISELFGDVGAMDWAFCTAQDGVRELIVGAKKGIQNIIFDESTQGQFEITGSADDKYITINVKKGLSLGEPLFGRIKFVKQQISLDDEVRQFIKEQEQQYESASSSSSSGSSSRIGSPTRRTVVSSG